MDFDSHNDMLRITLAECRSAEQTARMTQVTEQAAAAWKHPGWRAANMDSQPLLKWLQDLLRQQVGLPFCLLSAVSVPEECMFTVCMLFV